jgi:4-amino-4-deoxy-L-arabinose transferase-like glycosyltransferase
LLKRIGQLALATLVLLSVSLSWALVVDLTPASQRPYVGSSTDNSEIQLITQYNGLNRLLPRRGAFPFATRPGFERPAGAPPPRAPLGGPIPFGPGEIGTAGPLRLFNPQLAGQIAWLLPLALAGLVVGVWKGARDRMGRAGVALFGGWLLTEVVFFSVAGEFHRYYLTTMAPALAAITGIGIALLWGSARSGRWLLALALLGTAAVQAIIVWPFQSLSMPLTAVALAGAGVGAAALAWSNWRERRLSGIGLGLAVAAVLAAPAVWAGIPVFSLPGGNLAAALPAAGPALGAGPRFSGAPAAEFGRTDPNLLQYLEDNQGSTKYLVATPSSNQASPIILASGMPVMALGGFSGRDPIVSPDQLKQLVADGTIRYFLAGGPRGPGGGGASGVAADLEWVSQNCSRVASFSQLYDCAS